MNFDGPVETKEASGSDISDDEELANERIRNVKHIYVTDDMVGGVKKSNVMKFATDFEKFAKNLPQYMHLSWTVRDESLNLANMLVLSIPVGKRAALKKEMVDAINAEHERLISDTVESMYAIHNVNASVEKIRSLPSEIKHKYLNKEKMQKKSYVQRLQQIALAVACMYATMQLYTYST